MLDALKTSTDSKENIERARQYLRGVVGDLVRRKKIARRAMEQAPETQEFFSNQNNNGSS